MAGSLNRDSGYLEVPETLGRALDAFHAGRFDATRADPMAPFRR